MFLADIILAINLAAPGIPKGVASWYGNIIAERERKLHIDPLIEVSIATHESRWNSRLISTDGNDYGLLQIRAKFFTSNPESLLNGGNNLYLGAGIMKGDYNFCKKFLHREPEPQEFLSCFQGSCNTHAKTCKPTKMTNTIEKYAQCLEASLIARVSKNCNQYYYYDN